MADDSKDSQSKQFGDQYLGKLSGQLDMKAPVFGKSLFTGASGVTKDAWQAGNQFSNQLIGNDGFGTGQRGAMDSLGGVFSGYGAVADNGGLTAGQTGARDGLAGLGSQYGALGTAYDPNSEAYQTLRGGISDDVLTEVASLGSSNGRFGSRSFNEGAAEGLGQALAGLDYGNMQNNINNQYRSLDSQRGIYGDTFNMDQTGTGNVLAGLGGQAATAGQQFGMGQTALTNEQSAIDGLAGIGAARDADRQGERLGQADLFDRKKNAELDRLIKIGAAFGDPAGAANEAPWWQQMLGYVAGNAGKAISGGAFSGVKT